MPTTTARVFVATMRTMTLLAAWPSPTAAQQRACPKFNFEGVTSLGSISLDWLDAYSGSGTCSRMLATGAATCATELGPGGPLDGDCDFTCRFCTPVEQIVPARPPCATYAPPGGQPSNDYYDSWQGPGWCTNLLADDKKSCTTTLSPTGSMPNFCDEMCGYCVPQSQQTAPGDSIARAAQQCRSEKCAPVAPIWARLAGPSQTCTVDNYWSSPADCVAWINSNADQSIEVPSMLPFSPTAFLVDNTQCGRVVANWEIEFGLSSLAECLQTCDIPGCESTDVQVGCHTGSLVPPAPPHETPHQSPPSTTFRNAAMCVLAVVVVAGVAVGIKTKGGLKEGRKPGDELSDSIYSDESL